MAAVPSLSQRIFEKYDKDRSGSISVGELKNICYEMGHAMDDAVLDKDGSGLVEYEEFRQWWLQNDRFDKLKNLNPQQEVRLMQAAQYFGYFDKDHSGHMTRAEFVQMHADLVRNKYPVPADAESCLRVLDQDSNGDVSFNEYIAWLTTIGAL